VGWPCTKGFGSVAKFGYTLESNVEKDLNHAILWGHATTYCLNMATSNKLPHICVDRVKRPIAFGQWANTYVFGYKWQLLEYRSGIPCSWPEVANNYFRSFFPFRVDKFRFSRFTHNPWLRVLKVFAGFACRILAVGWQGIQDILTVQFRILPPIFYVIRATARVTGPLLARNNLFIFRIFAPQDGFVLFFHNGLKIINLVRTGYATTVHERGWTVMAPSWMGWA
jgi:hypothetical protein